MLINYSRNKEKFCEKLSFLFSYIIPIRITNLSTKEDSIHSPPPKILQETSSFFPPRSTLTRNRVELHRRKIARGRIDERADPVSFTGISRMQKWKVFAIEHAGSCPKKNTYILRKMILSKIK